ncbi:putative ribonuclease H-like domain-containing protein [Tanacetum coccineum]
MRSRIPCKSQRVYAVNLDADSSLLGLKDLLLRLLLLKNFNGITSKCSRLILKLLLLNTRIKTAKKVCLEKLLLLSIITTAGTRVNVAEGLLLLEDLMLSEKISRPYQRKDKDDLKIKIRICYLLRIEQYFQVQDYALWDVIENRNSFKPVAQITTNADGSSTSLIPGPVTTEEKAQKKNDVKARNAQTLFAAIQTRFGGNEATKKTQKTLLKQMYENFSASSTESLDSIFNRLQKIVSQLAVLGENFSQEDLNLKFLRSLPSEWNTHVVVWRNKPDLDTMSFDDLYNNFKIVKQEVKGTTNSSSSSNSQNMAFVSSPSNTNEVNTSYGVSTANTPVSTASTQVSTASTQVITANLSDATVYAFLANQPNGSQLVHEDLEQIHEDDLKEIDLKWQLALLSIRARRFFQKTGRKITINRSDTTGYDKTKVECFNCNKMGHFARECRGPRNHDSRNRNQDSYRRTIPVEDTSSKAMVAIDGAATYKRGLASVEEQLVFYKKNEVMFCEQIAVLKRDISYKDLEINVLNSELEKHKQEKESNQLKIDKFENASKSLDKLIGSQINDNSRKGVGFPEFEGYGPKHSKNESEDISNEVRKSTDTPLVEELVSDDKLEKKTAFPNSVPCKSKAASVPAGSRNSSASVTADGSDPAASRNRSAVNYASRPKPTERVGHPAGWSKRPAPVSADRPVSAGWLNPAARPFFKTSSVKGGNCRIWRWMMLEYQKRHPKRTSKLDFEKCSSVGHLKPFGCQVTILNTSDHLGKFEGKADEGYLVGYASNSKAYRVYNLPNKRVEETMNLRFLEDKPKMFRELVMSGTQETNINTGTQDHDSDSEVDEQVIVVPSFPSNSFAGPSSSNGPSVMERNADYAEELAKLQRQEYEAKDAAARYGYLFSQATAEILCQAEAEIRNQGVSAVTDPAGIDSAVREPAGIVSADGVSTGSPSADSDPAGSNPADCFPPAGSFEPADESNPAVSSSVSADFNPVYADESTLPPGQQLGSSENTTRFPVPSDVCMDQISSGIFTSSSYDDDFRATLTNLAPAVEVNPVPTKRVNTIHPQSQILGDLASPVMTRSRAQKSKFGESAFIGYIQDQQRTNHTDQLHCLSACFLSQLEPTSIAKALEDPDWVDAMQEEMQQFINQQVWKLVPLPVGKHAIGTKWILKNKRDARGIVVRNKARLVAQGHRQEEGIDYDEVFAPVARIEAIRLFLAFASYMGFLVYQLDVKSAFLYGEIEEEVYVTQPKGFEDPYFPKHVYRVVKALYGLHQAPRAWYARLSTFLLQHNYRRGTIDKTLFIKKDSRDIILVQVYVDDIIFGSTNKAWCDEFEVLMKGEFEMSAMGEMTFFLGLQVKQLPDGLFISQDKYVKDMLTKFDMDLRLISWQCKKQTIVATSSTEAEYVAAASCCAQVLWIQNQLLDYGFNFMNTKIFIDNQSTICIVKNPVFHQRTKHIEIRHHFIRDANEKNLIQCSKILLLSWMISFCGSYNGSAGSYPFAVRLVFCWSLSILLILFSAGTMDTLLLPCTMLVAYFLLVIQYADRVWHGVVYAANTSIHAARLVCAGGIMFLLADLFLLVVTCFCCAQLDIAGWLVSATSHLVSAGSLHSCWCMGRIDSLETELGNSKKIMGGAILTLVSRVKKLERTVKQLRTARFVGDAPATEGDVDIQDDVDIEGLSRMASEALGHDHQLIPSEIWRTRRGRRVSRTAISEPAGPSIGADKGKAPMPDLDIPAEFLAEDAQP